MDAYGGIQEDSKTTPPVFLFLFVWFFFLAMPMAYGSSAHHSSDQSIVVTTPILNLPSHQGTPASLLEVCLLMNLFYRCHFYSKRL